MSLLRLTGIGIVFLAIVLLAFLAADAVGQNENFQSLVRDFGFVGIVIIAAVSGLNMLVPVPAATFTPVFTAAGFSSLAVILALVIGTTIADLIGYCIGYFGKKNIAAIYPRIYEKVVALSVRHRLLLLPCVFLYAAIVPFPNEAVVIPLGLIGFRLSHLIVPLVLGTTVHQTVLALGFSSVFELFFGV